MTLSTSGVVPQIEPWAATSHDAGLSRCTRCATTCATCWCRSTRNGRFAELLAAVRGYPQLSNARRVTLEYVMLRDINDSDADARELVRLLAAFGQDQSHPVQPVAGAPTRLLVVGADRKIRRLVNRRRLCEPGAHAARPRHLRRLRPAQIGDRAAHETRPRGARRVERPHTIGFDADDTLGSTNASTS